MTLENYHEVIVNWDLAALVDLDAAGLEAEVLGVGAAADADHDDVGVELLTLAVLDILHVDLVRAVGLLVGAEDLGAHFELEALLLEGALEVLGNFAIDTDAANGVQELDNGDLGAKAAPHRAQLKTDNTTTNNSQILWNF